MTNQRSGFSLVLTIIAVSTLSTLLLSLFSLNRFFLNNASRGLMRVQALALAEGGIDKALHELSYNSTYSGEDNLMITGSPGVADITVQTPDSATRIITSTAYIPAKLNPKIKRKLRVTAVADPNATGNAFTFAVQAGEGGFYGIEKKNPTIHGSIYSNENVEILGPGSVVDGNIDAVGTINVRGIVGGIKTEGVTLAPMPTVDIDYWKQQAQDTGETYIGDYIISGSGNFYLGGEGNVSVIDGRLLVVGNANIYLKGPVWIKGTGGSSIEISSNPHFYISADLEGNKTIILNDGKVAISGNATVESQKPDAWVLLISTYPGSLNLDTSGILINANVHLEDTILYGYNSAVEFAQNSSGVFAGAFVAQKIIIKSNLNLTYQSGLGSISFEKAVAPDGGGFTVVKSSFAELQP
ncbi:MAG: hypothetical protein UR93_C0012G0008 [Berkelbacteria bacterium GW2011_GWA2_35_9]|uniref:Type 4 fimbrial biogenesis protein PilX N-terminal domain-containing protein n=1 Tax=Berkelbacteria bacterium GW2011_GWA2_35_9 TaxID=1618333 RepID=A0A0G0FM74_9BACT|nr:MAG: hypothetical protein UR93_C0012G0008 [Berkelbacteria bacterium GW2011_GWA2_35_9]